MGSVGCLTPQNGGIRPGQWEKRNAAAGSGGEPAAGQPAPLDSLRVEGLPAEACGGGAAEPAVRAAFFSFPLLHLIFSYYAGGCVGGCTGDNIIRYFPPPRSARSSSSSARSASCG
jgi:hypothetical protein